MVGALTFEVFDVDSTVVVFLIKTPVLSTSLCLKFQVIF